MKNKHYFCRNKIWIMVTLCLFTGCYDSESWVNVTEQPTKAKVTITAEEAQASFENEMMSKATRSISTRKEDLISFSKHRFPMGNIIPKWSSGEASSASKFANYETPIRSSYLYRAWRHKRIGKNKKKEWICTKIIHKLLVVKDAKTNKMHNYIELLIPTIHFLNHHRNFNFNQLRNDGNMLGYSGLKVYTTLDGYLIRVNEYRNGKRGKGVYLTLVTSCIPLIKRFSNRACPIYPLSAHSFPLMFFRNLPCFNGSRSSTFPDVNMKLRISPLSLIIRCSLNPKNHPIEHFPRLASPSNLPVVCRNTFNEQVFQICHPVANCYIED